MTDTTTPTIRDATLDDAPAMLEVIQAAFEGWSPLHSQSSALEYLRWKMSPPSAVPLHHAIVEFDDRVAATQLRWVGRMLVGGREYPTETGADVAVHPDFQRRGLARLIKDRDHHRLVAGQIGGFGMLSNAPQVRHMNEPNIISRQMTTWTRPFQSRRFAVVHLRDGGVGQLARAARRALTRRTPAPAVGQIETLDRFDDRTDALWLQARDEFDLISFRDADYLNWRFTPAQNGRTTILGLVNGERVLAYVALRLAADRGDLMDWLWVPEAEPDLPALLATSLHRLRALGARRVDCWLPDGHRAEPALHAAGFARVGTQHILFGGRNHGESPPEVLDVCEDPTSKIHLTMSDFDHA
jgi:hypothetical protein